MRNDPFLLVVDGNLAEAELTFREITRRGFTAPVIHLPDGLSTVDFLLCRSQYQHRPQIDPTLMVLDVRWHLSGGFELLECLKSVEKLRTIPMAFISSPVYWSEPDDAVVLRLGTVDCVGKPASYPDLSGAIAKIVEAWDDILKAPAIQPFIPAGGNVSSLSLAPR